MATGALWHTRPLFITSTFRDMQAERDWLRDRVFPALEERLRERRTHLEPIDLRWGVETVSAKEEEAKELLVLKVCLAEVERSRPFLIGLLGDRYGWVPPEDRMEAAAREAGFEQPVVGRSVTDLEIDFGVLSSAEQRNRCRFYFREPLPYDELIASGQMTPEKATEYSDAHRPGEEDGIARLDALKARIEKTLPDRVRTYQGEWDPEKQAIAGLETWGEQVLEDLWQELEPETAEWAQAGEAAWQAAERFTLEQFLEDRTRDFVGREAILQELESLALSPPEEGKSWGACVTAAAGAGKSALFAALTRRLQEQHDITVLAHAAGISPQSTQVDRMLRRWVEELEGIAGATERLSEDAKAEEVEQAFHSLLGRVSTQQRVVLLIDALNQFEPTPRGKHLTWLPKLWPLNARLIVTAIPGVQSESLTQRQGIESKDLPLLDNTEAASIATTICRRYRRTLHPEVVERLLTKQHMDQTPAAGNALWLQLAVEELNLLDADDFSRLDREFEGTAEQKLHQLLLAVVEAMPAEVEGLYGWLLERAEQLFSKAWVQNLVSLIAVSRAGWRESDFRVLIQKLCNAEWEELRFAAFRRTFRAHVVQRGSFELWDFSHRQMRQAIMRRNFKCDQELKELHGHIADYLAQLPCNDPLHESETMVHLIGADLQAQAAHFYGRELTRSEEIGATHALTDYVIAGEKQEPNTNLEWVVGLMTTESLDVVAVMRLANHFNFILADALQVRGVAVSNRLRLHQSVVDVLSPLCKKFPLKNELQRELSVSYERSGEMLRYSGDLNGALSVFKASLAVDDMLQETSPDFARMHDQSCSNDRVGDVLHEMGDAKGALQYYRTSLAITKTLTTFMPEETEYQRSISVSHVKVGDVLRANGELELALDHYQAALDTRKRLTEQDSGNKELQRDLSVTHERLGEVFEEQVKLTEALVSYRTAMGIREALLAEDPDNVRWQKDIAVIHRKVGNVLQLRGDFVAAFEEIQTALVVDQKLVAQDPYNTGWQTDLSSTQSFMGHLLKAQGNLLGAFKYYQSAKTIYETLTAHDPNNTSWQEGLATLHQFVGDLLMAQGDWIAALNEYQQARETAARLVAQNPRMDSSKRVLSVVHDKLGRLLVMQGDWDAALEAHQKSLEIIGDLVSKIPSNINWQNDLAVSHYQLGNAYEAHGDIEEATKSYQAALEVMRDLSVRQPTNSTWQVRMSLSLRRISILLKKLGDLGGALANARDELAITEAVATQEPVNERSLKSLANSCQWVEVLSGINGQHTEAAKYRRKHVDILMRMKHAGMHLEQYEMHILDRYAVNK